MTAAVVENEPIQFKVEAQSIEARYFVADTKTYYYQTDVAEEAFYLAAILNASLIDRLIKPMQSRGLWGPRDIHKKVLELPIPKFNHENPFHRRMAQLGQACSPRVEQWLASGGKGEIKSIGRLRSMVREVLRSELAEIDCLVKDLLEIE